MVGLIGGYRITAGLCRCLWQSPLSGLASRYAGRFQHSAGFPKLTRHATLSTHGENQNLGMVAKIGIEPMTSWL